MAGGVGVLVLYAKGDYHDRVTRNFLRSFSGGLSIFSTKAGPTRGIGPVTMGIVSRVNVSLTRCAPGDMGLCVKRR